VENFLGPEICNNNVVKNSKLSVADKEFFDRDLTLLELDVAANSLNEKSAGGLDGVSSKFIKNFGRIYESHYINMLITVSPGEV
jgi:hypothetical protein